MKRRESFALPRRMSYLAALLTIPLLAFSPCAAAAEVAGASVSSVPGSATPPSNESVYDQLVSLSAGTFSPRSPVISNGSYGFNYGSGVSTVAVEAGWGVRIFNGFFLEENLGYSRLSGGASSQSASGAVPDASFSVLMIGLDSRLAYCLESFPLHWLIPFVEGGYRYTFFDQSGSSDLDSAQGGTGNFVGGAGARIWVNRSYSLDTELKGTYTTIPVFLMVKYNRIFPNSSSLDLAESGVEAGVSIGL